jgi:hypothetical protein
MDYHSHILYKIGYMLAATLPFSICLWHKKHKIVGSYLFLFLAPLTFWSTTLVLENTNRINHYADLATLILMASASSIPALGNYRMIRQKTADPSKKNFATKILPISGFLLSAIGYFGLLIFLLCLAMDSPYFSSENPNDLPGF